MLSFPIKCLVLCSRIDMFVRVVRLCYSKYRTHIFFFVWNLDLTILSLSFNKSCEGQRLIVILLPQHFSLVFYKASPNFFWRLLYKYTEPIAMALSCQISATSDTNYFDSYDIIILFWNLNHQKEFILYSPNVVIACVVLSAVSHLNLLRANSSVLLD